MLPGQNCLLARAAVFQTVDISCYALQGRNSNYDNFFSIFSTRADTGVYPYRGAVFNSTCGAIMVVEECFNGDGAVLLKRWRCAFMAVKHCFYGREALLLWSWSVALWGQEHCFAGEKSIALWGERQCCVFMGGVLCRAFMFGIIDKKTES